MRATRRWRAEFLDQVHTVVDSASFFSMGYRSATDWLICTTHEGAGHCKVTLLLADRIQHMPHVKPAFADGTLAESTLRLLCDAWHPDIADQFARDEVMLLRWATTLPHRDVKMILDTWRTHADPDRVERTAQERFDRRALHLSTLLDGMGRLDGTLDPEGLALVREAIRAYSQPVEGETRASAQRRADALVTICRMALEGFVARPGRKRRKPKVVATIAYADLVDQFLATLRADETTDAGQADGSRLHAEIDCEVHADADCNAEIASLVSADEVNPDVDRSPTTDAPNRSLRHVRPHPSTRCAPLGAVSRPPGRGGTLDTDHDRIVVGIDSIRRMACDCNVHRYVSNPLGTVVDYGRTNRVVSDSLFDTLLIRDHGCRWPGCSIPAGGCDAHHATHWLDLGETEPDNLVLICWFHHHLLHERHWRIEPHGGGHFTLHDPYGTARDLRPPLVGLTMP